MSRLRSSIYYVLLISLLLAACSSAQAGTVSLDIDVQPAVLGPDGAYYITKGCTVTFVYSAADCDEYDSICCWDDLSFTLPVGFPLPTKVGGSIYRGEHTVICDSPDPTEFVFSADDTLACNNQENDDPASRTITIKTYELENISVEYAPWMMDPNAPICPCPSGEVTFTTSTIPAGYAHLIPWTGGGVPETGTGASFVTYWTTSGTKTVTAGCGPNARTATVTVAAPYYETGFVDLTEPAGGNTALEYQVKTRCMSNSAPVLYTRRTAAEEWGLVPSQWQECSRGTDVDGVYTISYPFNMWSTIKREVGGDDKLHNLDKVDEYMLRGETQITPCTTGQAITDTQTDEVDVHNLTVESVSPEGVVYWNADEGTPVPITVTIEDNDLTDPVTLKLEMFYTAQDNREEWTADATLTATNVTSSSYTFNWNGTVDGQPGSPPLESGTYTYEVTATQTDSGHCHICDGVTEPEGGCAAGDVETYRSEYLTIVRATDDEGNPIYDVEYDGYDNGGTEGDESDDGYYYIIRKYKLVDALSVNASGGVIWLYGPDGQRKYEWPINTQPCVEHDNACDGLHASTEGTEHSLRIRVPVDKMPYADDYRFVIHAKDEHGNLYRNGDNRWALDLNETGYIGSYTVWMSTNDAWIKDEALSYGQDVAKRVQSMGYKPHKKNDQDPEDVGTGKLIDIEPRLTIRTLYRRSPCDPASHDKYRHPSAIWMYAGHGGLFTNNGASTGCLEFMTDSAWMDGLYIGHEYCQQNCQRFNIDAFDLDFVRLAYLMACYSAGGTGHDQQGNQVTISNQASMAHHFVSAGAKAAIGFREILYAKQMPFKKFHKVFWNTLDRRKTVYDAYRDAKAAAVKLIPEEDLALPEDERKYQPFHPLRFGRENGKIK